MNRDRVYYMRHWRSGIAFDVFQLYQIFLFFVQHTTVHEIDIKMIKTPNQVSHSFFMNLDIIAKYIRNNGSL